MTQYNLINLSKTYYETYLRVEFQLWNRITRAGHDIKVEETFEDLPSSEQDCIICALRAVVISIDPDATFIK